MKGKKLLFMSTVPFLILNCTGEPSVNQQNSSSPQAQSVLATATESASPKLEVAQQSGISKQGMFVKGEHPTQGKVSLVSKNNQLTLEFDSTFKTDEGPDLVVVLHRSADVIGSTKPPSHPLKEGEYTVIAPLQKYNGTQSYSIPASVKVAEYKSVAIWCRKFNATFGAATLK